MELLLTQLSAESWDAQATVIKEAAERGGFIDRDSVYALSGYEKRERGRYEVVLAAPFDLQDHREGTVARTGKGSLHGCGEPAVATMVGRTRSGREYTLA